MTTTKPAGGPVDHARPGRIRRLMLTFLPLTVAAAIPYALLAAYGDRIPATIVNDGDRLTRLMHAWLYVPNLAWAAIVFGVAFAISWRQALGQRTIVALSFAFGALFGTKATVEMLLLADSTGVVRSPGWLIGLCVPAFVLGGLLGWKAAGPMPAPPTATEPPPPGVFVLDLGPRQKAVFTDTAWSRSVLMAGLFPLAMVVLSLWTGAWPAVVLCLGVAVQAFAQARCRLRIDESGVSLIYLGMVRQSIAYDHVEAAFAFPTPPAPAGFLRTQGVVSGRGPVLILTITDGRELRFSTGSAVDAAALVNARLTRERTGADHD